jgi:hypothetical protein
MALPTIIASNQTGGAIFLDRLGLNVPASGTLVLTDFAFVEEIRSDETLHAAIVSGNILLDYGQGELSQGESLKFFNIVTQEIRIPVKALSDSNVGSLSGTTTIDSVSLVADDRVLLTGQSTASQNGIWVVKTGAWQRPDDFGTGESASGALIFVDEGSVYGDQLWNCTSNKGSDVIGTDNLAFTQTSGAGGATDLQEAYENGNTITTDSGNGDVVVEGTESLQVTATGGLDVDTVFDFDGTSFDVQMTGTNGFSIDGTAASNVTVDSGSLTLSTTTSGDVDVSSVGAVDIDGATGVEIDSSGGAIDIGSDANTGAINIGTGAAARTITVGNATGATAVDVNTGTGGFTVDTTSGGAISLDGAGAASNFSVDAGNLTLETTTSGNLAVSSAGTLDMDSSGDASLNSAAGDINVGNDADDGDINIGTGTTAGRDINIGNSTGTTGVTVQAGTGLITLDATQVTMTGNLDVQGTVTSIDSETLNVADNHVYLNKDYTTNSPQTGGLVVNYLPTTDVDTVAAGGFTAGVASTSNPTIATTAASVFSVGDFIQISNAADPANDGLYEVLSHSSNVLTVRGVGTTATVEDFTQNQFVDDSTAQGNITKVNISAIRAGTDGVWEVSSGSTTGLSFTDLVTAGGTDLQTAYEAGNTITTSAPEGDVVISGTESLQVTATGGLDVDTAFDFDGSSFDVQMTGTNGFSIDGTAASNVTVDAGDLTLSTTTSGSVLVDGQDGVEINSAAGALQIGNDANTGAINIGTGAAARTVTVGNTTGATGVVINSGTEQVEIDGVTYYGANNGNPTATGSGFQDGDKYYDTGLDMEMRYDATRGKWLSVETSVFQVGRNGNTRDGQYYRGVDRRVLSATLGYTAWYDGTIVGFAYTRDDTDAATFEVTDDGATVASLASSATSGSDNTLDGDFASGSVLAVRNAAGGNRTSDVQAWVRIKWRA